MRLSALTRRKIQDILWNANHRVIDLLRLRPADVVTSRLEIRRGKKVRLDSIGACSSPMSKAAERNFKKAEAEMNARTPAENRALWKELGWNPRTKKKKLK